MAMIRIFLFATLALLSISASAYIPPYSMILSRVAENHGRGNYVIEQDVIYKSDVDTQTVREIWTVIDENRMKVSFQGLGNLKDVVKGVFIYDGSNRTASEGAGVKTRKVGEDWSEPFFHFRYSKPMRNKLVNMKFAPNESLRESAPMKSDGPPNYTPESFLKLARQNGMVAWSLSRNDGAESPELWIGQDQFVITRVRMPSRSQIDAEEFAKHDGGLYFPRTRTYKWNSKQVTVQVRSIKSLGSAKIKNFTSTANLTPFQFSGGDVLKEFYLRFR